MTKSFMAIIAITLISCGTSEKKEAPKEETATATAPAESAPAVATVTNTSGYTPVYSGSFSIGDVKNAETVLALYKSWDSGNLDPLKGSFSDSVTFYLADGSMVAGRRDSAIASMQAYRNGFSEVKNKVHAVFPVKSADKNENWVCIWATEYMTNKKGKKDSSQLQETWRFDNDGKVNLLYQFAAKAPKPKK
jgi:ketosteroid isomerase-like protein